MIMMMLMMIKVGNQTRDNYLNNVTLLVTLLIAVVMRICLALK